MPSLRVIIKRADWSWPSRCEVLQFGGTSISGLDSLTDNFKVVCLPLVGESLNLRIFVLSILRLKFGKWGYYSTYVRLTGAKVILVWHDTNLDAFLLSHHVSPPVFLVQNGLRHNFANANAHGWIDMLKEIQSQKPHVDKYFVFGNQSISLLKSLVECEFVTIGSFRLNHYATNRKTHKLAQHNSQRRVGLIVSFPNSSDVPGSHIHGNTQSYAKVDGKVVSYSEWYVADGVVAQALASFCLKNDFAMSVIGKRSHKDPIEVDYFAQVPGLEDIPVLLHEKGRSYEIAEDFDFLVAIDSTLGYELLALGHRVAFVSNRFRMIGLDSNEMTFGWPLINEKNGPIWTSAITRTGIEEFLAKFVALTTEEWEYLYKTLVPELMNLDPGNTVIRSAIDSVISSAIDIQSLRLR